MTILESGLTGAGGVKRLAPDLTYPSQGNTNQPYISSNETMVGGVEKEILTLTGKYAVTLLSLSGLINENMTIRMVVDGVEIWNDTASVSGGAWELWNSITSFLDGGFLCSSSLSLYLTTTTDTSITLRHQERKVL